MSLQKRSTGRQVSTFCFGKHTTTKTQMRTSSKWCSSLGKVSLCMLLVAYHNTSLFWCLSPTKSPSCLLFSPRAKNLGKALSRRWSFSYFLPRVWRKATMDLKDPLAHSSIARLVLLLATWSPQPSSTRICRLMAFITWGPLPKMKRSVLLLQWQNWRWLKQALPKRGRRLDNEVWKQKSMHGKKWQTCATLMKKLLKKNIYPVVSIFGRQQSRRWTTSNRNVCFKMNAFFAFSKKYMHCISPLATVISSSLYGCFVASVPFKPVLATVWCLSAFVEAQYQLFPWSLCWLQFGFQNPRAFMATFLWNLEFSMLFFSFAITVVLLFGSLLWLQIGQNHV